MKFRLRPSASSRWLKCPESVVLAANAPPKSVSNDFSHADMGTAAHELIERCIVERKSAHSFISEIITVDPEEHGDLGSSFIVDQEMADNVQFFLDNARALETGGNVYPELKLQHSVVTELEGTIDRLTVHGTHAWVTDYKNGTAPVIAQHRNGDINTQLLCYTSLAFDKFPELETATLSIIQPRIKTKKKIRSAEVTRQDVSDFMVRVQKTADTVRSMLSGSLPLKPVEGGYCWYCDANKICPVKREALLDEDLA